MWYADTIYNDTNYVAVVAPTDGGEEVMRGVLSSEVTEFSVSHAWGDPPSNPITSITRTIASTLTSAAQSADSLKSAIPQLTGEVGKKLKDFNIINGGTEGKLNNIASELTGLFVNEGQVVIPAGEYFKTYCGTNYEVPGLSVTTILIADKVTGKAATGTEQLDPSSRLSPGSSGKTLEAIVGAFVPPDAKESDSGLFIQMSAPGGYSVPTSITGKVKGSFKVIWGDKNDPKELDNLLPANIQINRSNAMVRIPGGDKTYPLYYLITVSFIPAKAYTKADFIKLLRGEAL